jgi:hypothetical protein
MKLRQKNNGLSTMVMSTIFKCMLMNYSPLCKHTKLNTTNLKNTLRLEQLKRKLMPN